MTDKFMQAVLNTINASRREGFLQGLEVAASIVAQFGSDQMPATELYEEICARIKFERENPPEADDA